ncbi:transcription repressor OFP13 [Carica papaya]|uniref:transcription repressor OFP13 n=1 Tax=Carica papaya TaxID=3649 RepID=UPI000B8CB112|nr:transcription repressor OFP13 [Carica papaya]
MGKKMKLPSLFKTTKEAAWQWPLCKQPKTLSFRAGDDIFKTVNSVFFEAGIETPDSWFTNSSESASFSTESDEFDGESLEMVVRGVMRSSQRLFFEPGGESSSILGESPSKKTAPFEESVVLAMESDNPYVDFRRSMEEMVEWHGLKEWEGLEKLLSWYLKVNKKKNHGFIVGAFIDLFLTLSSTSVSTSYSSAVSSWPSPPSCSRQDQMLLSD